MRLHYLRHVPYEGLGLVERWARRAGCEIRETHVWTGAPFPALADLDWLVVLGGPMGVCDGAKYPWLADERGFIAAAIEAGTQVLGICLGGQLVASILGAEVRRHTHSEIGWHRLEPTMAGAGSELAPFFGDDAEVIEWHHDTFDIPRGATRLCGSHACENQAFRYGDNVLALQFHPEIDYAEAAAILEVNGGTPEGPFAQRGEEILDASRFERLEQLSACFLDRYVAERFDAERRSTVTVVSAPEPAP